MSDNRSRHDRLAVRLLQVRLPERLRLWSVSGGSACSAPGKCGGQSH